VATTTPPLPAPKGLALLVWLRAVRGEKESPGLGSDCLKKGVVKEKRKGEERKDQGSGWG
jgi:hypothetical protein